MRPSLLIILLSFLFSQCTHHYCTSKDTTHHQYIEIHNQENDSSILQCIAPYKANIDNDLNVEIAETTTPLEKNTHCNNLAQLVYESMQWYADSLLGREKNYTVLINYGGLRANIPQGKILKRNIYELMPFDNTIVILKLNEEQMQTLTDISSQNPKLLVKSKTKQINNILITSDYLYQGGDDCAFLKTAQKISTPNYLIRDLIIRYCLYKKEINPDCFH